MTIKQAVINVCTRLHQGDKLFVYEIYDRVRAELKRAAYDSVPTQETVQRRFREVSGMCCMEYNGNQYVKSDPIPPLTAEEKKAGQKVLFV